VTIFRII